MKNKKLVMSVGQCIKDHILLSNLFGELGFEMEKVDIPEEAYKKLKNNSSLYDLVLINRKIDIDYSDGIELLKKIKSDPDTQNVKVMIVSNYPEVQQEAVKNGAIYGFGKAELQNTETKEKIINAIN